MINSLATNGADRLFADKAFTLLMTLFLASPSRERAVGAFQIPASREGHEWRAGAATGKSRGLRWVAFGIASGSGEGVASFDAPLVFATKNRRGGGGEVSSMWASGITSKGPG